MKKITSSTVARIALAVLAMSVSSTLHADELVGFTFAGAQSSSPTSSFNDTSVRPVTLTLGSGLTVDGGYNNNDFGVDVSSPALTPDTTLANAIALNDYLSFTVTPTAGSTITLTDLKFVVASFGADTDLTLTTTAGVPLGLPATLSNSSGSSYQQTPTLTIAGGDTITSATTFRLYVNASPFPNVQTSPGNPVVFNTGSVLGTSFSIDGTAAMVPEPSTYALLGLGGLALLLLARRFGAKA